MPYNIYKFKKKDKEEKMFAYIKDWIFPITFDSNRTHQSNLKCF